MAKKGRVGDIFSVQATVLALCPAGAVCGCVRGAGPDCCRGPAKGLKDEGRTVGQKTGPKMQRRDILSKTCPQLTPAVVMAAPLFIVPNYSDLCFCGC